MKGKTVWICVLILIALVSVSSLPAIAQTIKWSPPDKSFTVQVPVKLKIVKDAYGEADDPNAVTTFAANGKKYTFLAMILRYPESAPKSSKDKFGGWWFVIGGDDDYDFTETDIKVDGLPALEVVYKNQNRKGILIDAGDTVYVLGIFVKDRKELESTIAKQFFKSFRLTIPIKQKTIKKPAPKLTVH